MPRMTTFETGDCSGLAKSPRWLHLGARSGVVLMLIWSAVALLPPARAEAYSWDDVYAAAAEAFGPGRAAYATRIAGCETGWTFNPYAVAQGYDSYYGWYRYDGVWQIDWDLHGWRVRAIFGEWRDRTDLRTQAYVAAHIQREQGWSAWPYCSRVA